MSKVFISYRRDDSAGYAQAIYRELVQHFSKDRLFMDVDTLEPGADFVRVIEEAVNECDVLLALIGKRWANVGSGSTSRLNDAEDFVRLEISTALARDIPVIPVLLDGMTMPSGETLPTSLKSLSRRNAIEISNTRFNFDVERLITTVRKILDKAEAKRKADEENRRRIEEERNRVEQEQRRIEAQARQRKEERLREQQQQRTEEEAREKAQDEERRRVEEQKNHARQEEERRRLEAEAQHKAEEELREQQLQRIEEEARRSAEEEQRKQNEHEAHRARLREEERIPSQADRARQESPAAPQQDVLVPERFPRPDRRQLYAGAAVVIVIGVVVMAFWFFASTGIKEQEVKKIVSLGIQGKRQLNVGEKTVLRVGGRFSDGSEADVTENLDWHSNDDSVVAVSQDGQVEARKGGFGDITVRYEGITSPPLTLMVREESPPAEAKAAQVATKVQEHIRTAVLYRDRGEYSSALAELAQAKSLDPVNKVVLAELGRTKEAKRKSEAEAKQRADDKRKADEEKRRQVDLGRKTPEEAKRPPEEPQKQKPGPVFIPPIF